MTEDQVIVVMGALAQETRLRIVRHLVRCGDAGAAAGEIGEAVGARPSRLSFHLSGLTEAGILGATKVSRSVVYRVDFAAMGALMGYLVHDCCADDPRVRQCC
jgi:DNA-binding transcriptional ArsR family regulator